MVVSEVSLKITNTEGYTPLLVGGSLLLPVTQLFLQGPKLWRFRIPHLQPGPGGEVSLHSAHQHWPVDQFKTRHLDKVRSGESPFRNLSI